MMTSEKKIQSAVLRHAKKLGLLVKRNHMGRGVEVGWPDAEVFFPNGRMIFMEFKTPEGVLSKMQAFRIKKLREFGLPVYVIDDVEIGNSVLNTLSRFKEWR